MQAVLVLDLADDTLGPLDRETGEIGDEIVWGVEDVRRRRAAVALGQIGEVVAEDEHGPTRRQRAGRPVEHEAPLAGRELEVEDADEVEGGDGRQPVGEVGEDPVDVDVPARRTSARLRERDLRVVDAR